MAGHIIELNDPDFRREVLEAQEPVLVDFTATWCAPCRAITPALEALATEYKGRVKVTKLASGMRFAGLSSNSTVISR